MYEHMAENHVLALPRMADARGARSYGVTLMVAVILHAAFALFLSRPMHVAEPVSPTTNPLEVVTVNDLNEVPGPIDLSYRPGVLPLLPPAPGPGNGPANDVQAKINMSGLDVNANDGGQVIVLGGKQASLDSLLTLPQTGGNGRIGGYRARVDVPTVPYYDLQVKPTVVDAPAPVYPEAVRNAGIEGSVVVEALLNLDGSVMDARVLKSSGNDMLDAAAVEAALRARFTPAMQRDKAVRVRISQTYRFKLAN